MYIFKICLYSITVGLIALFAHLEHRSKTRLTDDAPKLPVVMISDLGIMNDFSDQLNQERFLETLPANLISKYKTLLTLKFVLIAALCLEVLFLQR